MVRTLEGKLWQFLRPASEQRLGELKCYSPVRRKKYSNLKWGQIQKKSIFNSNRLLVGASLWVRRKRFFPLPSLFDAAKSAWAGTGGGLCSPRAAFGYTLLRNERALALLWVWKAWRSPSRAAELEGSLGHSPVLPGLHRSGSRAGPEAQLAALWLLWCSRRTQHEFLQALQSGAEEHPAFVAAHPSSQRLERRDPGKRTQEMKEECMVWK